MQKIKELIKSYKDFKKFRENYQIIDNKMYYKLSDNHYTRVSL